jgi:hypothetical protein
MAACASSDLILVKNLLRAKADVEARTVDVQGSPNVCIFKET